MSTTVDKKSTSKKEQTFSLIKNIIRSIGVYWKVSPFVLVFQVIVTILIAAIPFLTSYFYGQLINKVIQYLVTRSEGTLNEIYMLFAYSAALGFILTIIWKLNSIAQRLSWFDWHLKFSKIVTEKLSSLDMSFYESSDFQTLKTKISGQYDYKPAEFVDTLIYTINDITQIIVSTIILSSLSIVLLPLILISLVPDFFVSLRASKLKWGIWDAKGDINKLYWEASGSLTDHKDIKEIRLFGTRSYLLDYAFNLKSSFLTDQKKILKQEGFLGILSKFFESAIFIGIDLWLLFKVITVNSGFGIGDYTFYLDTVNKLTTSTQNFLRNLNKLYEVNLFMTDLFKILDLENKIVDIKDAVILENKKPPVIEFKNVSFKYPGSENYTYKNLSMTINPGEDIAIVGENGAGKTTFVKLLCRFYDIEEGEILINGINIKNINLESWYKNIGVLFQDFNKYGFSGRENIWLGNVEKDNDLEVIKAAAKDAGADDLITKLKDGYDTKLSKYYESGVDLSGGEWQRVALARAFFRNANILILDEPTSAIDAKGEYEIFKKIVEAQDEKTTIIISHRFSTVKKANKIYVIANGEIVEHGIHKELIKIKNGRYKEMFELQAEGYK